MSLVSKQLLRVPRAQRSKDSYDIKEPNEVQQADLLFLPEDRGMKYLLVVADQSRRFDMKAIPSKSADDVLKGLNYIWSNNGRRILKKPKVLETDGGTDFSNQTLKEFLDKNDIEFRKGISQRKQQTAIVERANRTIASKIADINVAESNITGQEAQDWVDYIPGVVKELNKLGKKRAEKLLKKKEEDEKSIDLDGQIKLDESDILNIGDTVRVMLEKPKRVTDEKNKGGKFRVGDIRWSTDIKKVTNMIIPLPGQKKPLRYQVGDDTVSYTRNQLQKVSKPKDEDFGDYKKITKKKKDPDTSIASEVVGKKKIRGVDYYLVKYRGYSKPSYTLASDFVKNDHNKDLVKVTDF